LKFEKVEQVVGLILVEVGLMAAGLISGDEGLLDAGVGFLVVELALALMAVLMAVDGRDSFIASSKEGVEEGLMVVEEGLMVVEEGLMVVEEGLMTMMAVEEGMMAGLMFGEEGLLDAEVGFLVVELALMAVDGRDSFKASSSISP